MPGCYKGRNEEIVDVKKEQKRQALLQADVTYTSDDKDEDMEEVDEAEEDEK
ncbi:hypothetical protein H5410_035466 [Solanum commersonii]|uniref:Uncharacterized protein n=1 Tax=Solanum commersonii TaxID=4109 RepID=A0A9J5Y2R1_SOLCO|nr:hypothetical protein H5410_035466 [Solanum commersonii]